MRKGLPILIIFLLFWPAIPATTKSNHTSAHIPGQVYRVMYKEKVLTQLSRKPLPGDELYLSNGTHYRVIRQKGSTAITISLGKDSRLLGLMNYYDALQTVPVFFKDLLKHRPVSVGIYHTHTDESYLPSDGRISIPFNGGIYRVGEAFNNALKKHNVNSNFNKTPHDPHDNNAYMRSRRTAFKLLQNNPLALFDIHRDGVDDPGFYRQEINGNLVTQLRIVIGRQNPQMSANLEFAKQLMAYANKKYPDLIMEIYMAPGNYNQDILPTALLIEAGTYTNRKENAERGITMLANIVPEVIAHNNPEESISTNNQGRAAWKTTVFLIMLILIGGTLFAIINIDPKEFHERINKITGSISTAIKNSLLVGMGKIQNLLLYFKYPAGQLFELLKNKIIILIANGKKLLNKNSNRH